MPWSQYLQDVPSLIITGCIALVVVTLLLLLLMFRSAGLVRRDLRRLVLEMQQPLSETDPHGGLSLDSLDKLRARIGDRNDKSAEWWGQIDQHIEPYTASDGDEKYYLTEPLREVLPHDAVVGDRYYGSFFSLVPGILTGAGLALTFFAILVALRDVHYDKSNTTNPITGIDSLINGLSGKFLSSIVALVLSIVFTLLERSCSRSLRTVYNHSMHRIAKAIPYLSTSRILLDLHVFSAKQTASLSNFSSDLADRLVSAVNRDVVPNLSAGMSSGVANSLQAEFRPTMEKMAASLDGLQAAIVQIESQKQDSVTGEFERMARSLEASITQALTSMGEQFHSALVGSAKDEFGQAQDTMESTRVLLEQMSVQFAGMQTSFGAIAEKAGQATTDQLQAGREQAEALTGVMSGLMTRLQESADQNLSSMQNQLTRVVTDLTDRVQGLSEELLLASSKMADQTQENVTSVIQKTDEWSKASAARLEKLLADIEVRSSDFREASTALLEAKTFLSNLLVQNATALGQMQAASRDVQTYTTGLIGHSESLKSLSTNHLGIATNLRGTANELRKSSAQHEEVLEHYNSSVEQFKELFETLDGSIARVMQATSSGLAAYNESVEQNFDSIVAVANKLVPEAARLLQGQTEALQDQLEELADVIKGSVEKIRARTS